MGNAIGPDVSFYQDEPDTPEQIDFVKMGKTANFVIIRAGQNLWKDPDFKYNWTEAKNAALPRGSYWFYDSRADPKRQAELWVELLDGDFGELPLFADFEEAYNGQYAGWRKWYDFLERLKELIGDKEIAIYTAYYYWRDNAPNANSEEDSLNYFRQFPLWIANYGVSKPRVPLPWAPDEWLFWQFTEVGDGELYGVETRGIDLNWFNGDVADFRQRFNLPPIDPVPQAQYRVDISLRADPETDGAMVGTLQHDEIVDLLAKSEDDNWMQVRRTDNSIGWTYATHLIKVESSEPPDTGEPPDDGEPPDTEAKWYRVTAYGLNVREGPGTDHDKVGVLARNEVVKALDYAESNSWIKILRVSDGLTGWSSATYLALTDAPEPGDPGDPPDTDEPPDTGDPPDTGEPPTIEDEWYRVTASALNVREGPSTSNRKTGLLRNGEVVKALEKSADGNWIKIFRLSDGLTGWCYGVYLQLTDAPTDPGGSPDHISPPVPSQTVNWYQVKAATLNVREGPGTSHSKVGTLKQNEIVVALVTNEAGDWARVMRFDGLVGWCALSYLRDLGTTAPQQLTQRLFSGVTYFRKEIEAPNKMVAHVLAIDTRANGLKSLVTPPSHNSGLICTRRTSQFLDEFELQIAVNGDGFSYLDQDEYDPDDFCPNGGEPVKVNSYAASRGKAYSDRWDHRPIMYINKKNEVTFNKRKGALYNAISGDRMLVQKGKVVERLESQSVEPRTAAGTNRNGRWLFLVVIDGRQPGYSEGISFPELADFLISLGVYTGLNLDGGGSSTMVIEGAMGDPFILNSPIEDNVQGRESAVSNHLGIWIK